MPSPDKVREMYRECLPFYQRLKDQRQKNWDNFFGVWSGKTRSQIYVPLTFSKIQSMVAKVCMSFFNYPDFISINPVSEEDIMGAKSMQKLLDVQTKSEHFLLNFVMWVSYTMINSLSFIKVYWHKESKPYMKKIPIINKAGIVTGYKKEIVKDWAVQEPRFSVCNMDNLFFHPQSNYLFPEHGKFIIDQYLRPVSEVKKMMEKQEWNSVGEKELEESSRTLAEDWTNEYKWDDYHPNPFKKEYEIPGDPLVLITEYHEDSKYQIYANFKHVLKKETRPEYMQYKPYLSLKDYYIPHSVVGLGEAEILEDTQEYLNTIRNMRIDNWNLSINKMWVVDSLAGIDLSHLVSAPGKVIVSDSGTEGIKPLESRDIPASAYNEEKIAREDMDEATGTYRYVMGNSPERRETASGIMQVLKQANPKFDLKSKLIGIGLKRLVRIFGDMNIEYMDKELYIRQIGDDGKAFWDTVKPEEIPGRYDYDVTIVTDYPQKEIKREQLLNYYRYAMNRPTIYQHKLDELLLQQFEITESEIKDIVKFPPDEMAIKRNPADENQIVFSGGNIYVHPKDNHMEHIESHKQFYQQFFNTLKADRQEMLEEHILEHNEYAQKQQQFMPQPGMGMPGMPGMGMPEGGGQTTRSMPFTGLPRTINPNELIGQTQ